MHQQQAPTPPPHHIATPTPTHLDDQIGLAKVLPPLGVVVREGHHAGGGGVELVLGHALLLELALMFEGWCLGGEGVLIGWAFFKNKKSVGACGVNHMFKQN